MTEQNLENIKDGLVKTSVAEIKLKGQKFFEFLNFREILDSSST